MPILPISDYVARVVAEAPPLDEAQRDIIRAAFAGMHITTTTAATAATAATATTATVSVIATATVSTKNSVATTTGNTIATAAVEGGAA